MKRLGMYAFAIWLLSACLASVNANAGVAVSGSVANSTGSPICGLVLANGEFMFSCSPTGSYSLDDVPLDSAGQITLFAFAEGHFPFKVILTSGGRYDIVMNVASGPAPPPANSNRDKTALLLGGTWTYTYTIISTFSDSYTFRTMDDTPNASGVYFAHGTNPSGRLVVGAYFANNDSWGVLYEGYTIDYFYTFTFSGNNNVSGCYYQISPHGSLNMSRCYAMTGYRSPPKSMSLMAPEEQVVREVAAEAMSGAMELAAYGTYLTLKRQLLLRAQ
ncbi:MAG TPA: hypothetical protein VFP44_18830 [Usitatibacter sp.]|nr:hypothetical protein [Usitatibacter sp.]